MKEKSLYQFSKKEIVLQSQKWLKNIIAAYGLSSQPKCPVHIYYHGPGS